MEQEFSGLRSVSIVQSFKYIIRNDGNISHKVLCVTFMIRYKIFFYNYFMTLICSCNSDVKPMSLLPRPCQTLRCHVN